MDACTRWRTRAARACDSGGIWGSSLPIVSRQQAPESHAWPASYDNSTCVNFSPSFLPHHHLQRNDFSLLSESSNQQRLRTQRTTTITPRPPRNAAIDRSSHRHSDSATSKNIITQAPEEHMTGERTRKRDRPWTTTPESSFAAAAATVPLPHSAVRASGQINHQSTLVAIFNHAELSLERLMQISGTRHSLQEREHPQW